MKTRKEQAEETRQEVLDSFLSLIREKSFDDITIKDICQNAGVSIGTYYYYFKDKEECTKSIIGLMEAHMENFFDGLENGSACQKLAAYMKYWGTQYRDFLGLNASINVNQCQMAFEPEFFIDPDRTAVKHIRQLVSEAKQSGELKKGSDVEEITVHLINITRGIIYSWCLLRGSYDLIKTIEDVACSYIKAYKKD